MWSEFGNRALGDKGFRGGRVDIGGAAAVQPFQVGNGDMIAIDDDQAADARASQNWYRRGSRAAGADQRYRRAGEALIGLQPERARHSRDAFRRRGR
jgi:hypothetical protein